MGYSGGMEKQRPYSKPDLEEAKESISHAVGYEDKGLEAYATGLKIKSFKDFEGKRVLDLGAGAHLQFARGLERAGIKADVVSFSPAFADGKWSQNIHNRHDADPIVAGMGEELPFADNSFERIVSLDVPEHLGTYERYLSYLEEIVRVLAPNGLAFIGPTSGEGEFTGAAIPKDKLENLLGGDANVSYYSSHEIRPFKTMVINKRHD